MVVGVTDVQQFFGAGPVTGELCSVFAIIDLYFDCKATSPVLFILQSRWRITHVTQCSTLDFDWLTICTL